MSPEEELPTVYDSLPAEDNNGVMDRYTVFPAGEIEVDQPRCSYLGCSVGGRAFSQWGEIEVSDFSHLGRKVPVHELDKETQQHIFRRLRE